MSRLHIRRAHKLLGQLNSDDSELSQEVKHKIEKQVERVQGVKSAIIFSPEPAWKRHPRSNHKLTIITSRADLIPATVGSIPTEIIDTTRVRDPEYLRTVLIGGLESPALRRFTVEELFDLD